MHSKKLFFAAAAVLAVSVILSPAAYSKAASDSESDKEKIVIYQDKVMGSSVTRDGIEFYVSEVEMKDGLGWIEEKLALTRQEPGVIVRYKGEICNGVTPDGILFSTKMESPEPIDNSQETFEDAYYVGMIIPFVGVPYGWEPKDVTARWKGWANGKWCEGMLDYKFSEYSDPKTHLGETLYTCNSTYRGWVYVTPIQPNQSGNMALIP